MKRKENEISSGGGERDEVDSIDQLLKKEKSPLDQSLEDELNRPREPERTGADKDTTSTTEGSPICPVGPR